MASSAKISPTPPETLPADFSEWDSEDTAAALPAEKRELKPTPRPAPAPDPPTQMASMRIPAPAPVSPQSNAPTLTPAAAFADAEAFFQTFRPRYIDPEEFEPKPKHRFQLPNKKILAAFGIGVIVLLLTVVALLYPRLTAKPAHGKQTVIPSPSAAAPQTGSAPQQQAALPRTEAAPQAQSPPNREPVAAPPAAVVTPAATQPQVQSEMMDRQLSEPTRIPDNIKLKPEKDAPPATGFGATSMDSVGGSGTAPVGNVFGGQGRPKVKVEAPKVVNVSAGVAVGMLVQKTTPLYPQIAKTARVQGTVVLQATISKTGAIEGLRVISGPDMLRQAAVDAVRTWRYKPYLLNNQPVEVETTVNVVFSLTT